MYKNQFGPTPKYDFAETLNPENKYDFISIAGPCSVENEEQIYTICRDIADVVTHFRGGVFRAGTYPSNNWGWQMDLLRIYHNVAQTHNKPNIVDVLDIRDIEKIEPYTDVFQVGMRQGQHYALLKELGKQRKPVILKRGSWQKLSEFLGSMEYILKGGNENVILCERGGVSCLDHVRWELSISMVAMLKHITKFQVVVDASHGTGNRDLVGQMTFAGIAAGADGCLIETHNDPQNSMSDAEQAVSISEFKSIISKAKQMKALLNG